MSSFTRAFKNTLGVTLTNVDIDIDPFYFCFFVFNSKLRAERSILHINLCLAIAAGIALFLGGLKLTKIRVREITKERRCIFLFANSLQNSRIVCERERLSQCSNEKSGECVETGV